MPARKKTGSKKSADENTKAQGRTEKTAQAKGQTTAASTAAESPSKPLPRIAFSNDVEKYGSPPPELQIGIKYIVLPGPEEQLAGFEHEDWRLILRAARGYRRVVNKG